MTETSSAWLPADFEHPRRVPLSSGLHLRPVRASDVDISLPAVRGAQSRLWAQYGQEWGWPPPTLTAQRDYDDLHRHEQEIRRHESFSYALLNSDETALFGCVYLRPLPDGEDEHGAEVSWWVVEELVDSAAEVELTALVPAWVAERWPFSSARFPFNRPVTTAETVREVHGGAYDEVRTPLPALDLVAAEELWDQFCSARAGRSGRLELSEAEHPVHVFGDTVELADELIGLVVRGIKTATVALVSDYAADGQQLPRIGGHWLACDGAGAPRVVLRTLELRLGALSSVDDAFAWDEGEEDRSRRSWLQGHERYWARRCADEDTDLDRDALVFERFAVVWPPEVAAGAGAYAAHSVTVRPPAETG